MNEHLQHAMASMAAVVERARFLTRDEQEALALKLEALAEGLHWEQYFHLPDRFLAIHVTDEAVLRQAQRAEPPAPSSRPRSNLSLAVQSTERADSSRIPPSGPLVALNSRSAT
jgi:hypothetical protein